MEANGIGWAVKMMQNGSKVTRPGWNGKGMYLQIHNPENPQYQSYVEMWTADKKFVPWLCSQTDLLAIDWLHFTGV